MFLSSSCTSTSQTEPAASFERGAHTRMGRHNMKTNKRKVDDAVVSTCKLISERTLSMPSSSQAQSMCCRDLSPSTVGKCPSPLSLNDTLPRCRIALRTRLIVRSSAVLTPTECMPSCSKSEKPLMETNSRIGNLELIQLRSRDKVACGLR